MNNKLIKKYKKDAQNGDISAQRYLDYHNIEYGESANINGLTAMQTEFLSPRQSAQPKTKKNTGWQKTNNSMPIKSKQAPMPDYQKF